MKYRQPGRFYHSFLPRLRLDIRRLFAYPDRAMSKGPTAAKHPFVIACKGCRSHIPAPVETMPDDWIIAKCPRCGEKRRYVPADIFQGSVSSELLRKPVRSVMG